MKQFTKIMLVVLGFGLFTIILGSLPNHPTAQAETPHSPIHIVPVAVQNTPTVNVGNTPTVNVGTLPAITGSVSINGFSNTNANPLFVKDVNNPGLMPIQSELALFSNGVGSGYEVPRTGQELVIDYVAGNCTFDAALLPVGGGPEVRLVAAQNTPGGFLIHEFLLPLETMTTSGLPIVQFSQRVVIYVNPGGVVSLKGQGMVQCSGAFSGHSVG